MERMDSDESLDEDSDEYASIHFSDDDQAQQIQRQTMMESTKAIVVEANTEEEDNDAEGGEDELNETQGEMLIPQKKKDKEENEARFDVSLLDRIMRTRDRYLKNPQKHPGYQIEDVKKTVIQKTLILSQMLKKKLSGKVRSTVITFITILVYHRDFAAKLKRERIFKVTDFGW